MEEIIKLVQENGIWVFLIGLFTSIILGAVKTLVRKKAIPEGLTDEVKKKRENLFDTIVFISTYVLAFLGAMVYCLIITKTFNFVEIVSTSLPVWLSQSMVYGVWKKLGLKRLLQMLLRLIIKDINKDGKITLDEAIAQVKNAYKNGKLDVEVLLSEAGETAIDNFADVVEEMGNNQEPTEEQEAMVEAGKGNPVPVIEELRDLVKSATEIGKESEVLVESVAGNEDVLIAKGQAIKF